MQMPGWDCGHLDAFRLEKHAGEHSRLKFAMTVSEKELGRLLQKGNDTICVLDETSKNLVFAGRIDSISHAEQFLHDQIEVEAIGFTSQADEDVHLRVFQDPDKKISDVLSDGGLPSLKDARCKIVCGKEAAEQKLPGLLLQQETDFAFACRLAAAAGVEAWSVDLDEKTGTIFIGASTRRSAEKIDEETCLRLRCTFGRRPRASVTLLQYAYELGQRVTLRGKDYVIDHVIVERVHEIDHITYDMRAAIQVKKTDVHVHPLRAARLKGCVKSVEDPEHRGCVRVNFTDEDAGIRDMTPPKLWIPYRPSYAGQQGGIVFLPEPGDFVEAIVTGEEAFVTTEWRTKPLPQECQDVRVKYIGNNTEQRAFWKEKSLEFWSTDTKITLDDKNIDLSVGKTAGARIHIDEKNIVLTVGKNRVRLGEQGIAIERGTSEIVLDDKGTYLRRDSQQIALDQNVHVQSGGMLEASSGGATSVRAGGALKLDASGTASLKGSHVELA